MKRDGVAKLVMKKNTFRLFGQCPDGCGTEAVMPLKPHDPNGWDYSERDGKVTLSPSVATNCPYKAHFFIRENKIVWI